MSAGAQLDLDRESGATFSEDRVYRYALWRVWDRAVGRVNFVMLNPSTADEHADDPTITRCKGFARRWGYGGIVVTNLFALRSADPKELYRHADPVGPDADLVIQHYAWCAALIVVAWGNHGSMQRRDLAVLTTLRRAQHGRGPLCLGVNRTGQPVHPLYKPDAAELVPYGETRV